MRDAAAEERFEEAARHRNRLFAIESLAQRQAADKRAVGTIDVIGLAVDDDRAAVQLFPLRDGRMVDRFAFHLENVTGQDRATILESFCVEHYGSAPAIPPQIVVPPDISDTEALAAFLGDLRGGSRRGALAAARARSGGSPSLRRRTPDSRWSTTRRVTEQKRRRRVEALEELRESLNLESLPTRIECFDVSNIQGREIVASMAVFVDAQPRRAHYRTFAVRGLEGQDDFAAMGQVVSRRFARLRDAASPERFDESFARIPNLVVIDGGKGQLAAALEAIHATYDLPRVAVVALAKREEEVFVPGHGRRRSGSIATTLACNFSSVLGTRRTASRSATTAAAATPAPSSRSSTGSRGSGRRAGARSSPLRLRRGVRAGLARGARGRARPAGEDGARRLRAAPQGRARIRLSTLRRSGSASGAWPR